MSLISRDISSAQPLRGDRVAVRVPHDETYPAYPTFHSTRPDRPATGVHLYRDGIKRALDVTLVLVFVHIVQSNDIGMLLLCLKKEISRFIRSFLLICDLVMVLMAHIRDVGRWMH